MTVVYFESASKCTHLEQYTTSDINPMVNEKLPEEVLSEGNEKTGLLPLPIIVIFTKMC